VQHELRQKGVSAEMADEVTSELDDESSAYKAGVRKMRSLTSVDYDEFRRRLFGYLRRRGFSYEVAARVVERLWLARQTNVK
jgi:regulatory protein